MPERIMFNLKGALVFIGQTPQVQEEAVAVDPSSPSVSPRTDVEPVGRLDSPAPPTSHSTSPQYTPHPSSSATTTKTPPGTTTRRILQQVHGTCVELIERHPGVGFRLLLFAAKATAQAEQTCSGSYGMICNEVGLLWLRLKLYMPACFHCPIPYAVFHSSS